MQVYLVLLCMSKIAVSIPLSVVTFQAIKDETDRFAEKRKELKHGIKVLRKKVCIDKAPVCFQKCCEDITFMFLMLTFIT